MSGIAVGPTVQELSELSMSTVLDVPVPTAPTLQLEQSVFSIYLHLYKVGGDIIL